MRKIKSMMRNGFRLTILLAVFIVLFFPCRGYAHESSLKFQLEPGPYAVGFKAVNNYDYTRTFFSDYDISGNKVTQKARPIQTSIWYPADVKKAEKKERMRFIEYAYLMAHELGYRELTEAVKEETLRGFHLFFSTPEAKKVELEVITRAIRDAEPAEGSFPLLVYGASINCVSFENSVLFEHLASHGYIVVSSPCVGKTTRYVQTDLAGTETQARDILFLLAYMQDFPGVDKTRIALVGYSWGGMSNVLAAMRDTRISAVVCIDGSIAYNKYVDEIVSKSIDYNIDKMTMPLLFMRSKKIPAEIMKKYGGQPQDSAKFFEELKYSDAYFLRFNHLMHGDFCSTFLKFMDMKGPDNLESAPEQVNHSYNLMCKYVHCFLDATLKGDRSALEFISNTPQENKIAEGVITRRFKKGMKWEPSFGEFIYRVKKVGFDRIAAIYGEIKKDFPEYSLVEDRLTDLAFQMFFQGQLEDVYLLLKFTLEVHPKSSSAYYGLGEIYAIKGDIEAALGALEKAVELNPQFFRALKRLKELKEKSGK